jgi:hypothetical protein
MPSVSILMRHLSTTSSLPQEKLPGRERAPQVQKKENQRKKIENNYEAV